jgi:hypothetical protein
MKYFRSQPFLLQLEHFQLQLNWARIAKRGHVISRGQCIDHRARKPDRNGTVAVGRSPASLTKDYHHGPSQGVRKFWRRDEVWTKMALFRAAAQRGGGAPAVWLLV